MNMCVLFFGKDNFCNILLGSIICPEGKSNVEILFNNSGGNVATDDIPDPADDSNTGIVTNTGTSPSNEDGYHWKYMYSFRRNSIFYAEDTNFR